MNTRTVLAAAAATLYGATAYGQVYDWSWQPGDPGNYSYSNGGGNIEKIQARYHKGANALRWSTTFADQRTNGYTLAVNKGPEPKGHGGELALLFLDITDLSNPCLTAYTYNGKNLIDSWRDGDGAQDGDQEADFIVSSQMRSDWIKTLEVNDHGGKRTITFEIDASVLNQHDPRYGNGDDWYGMGFEEQIGLWFHTFEDLETSYDGGSIDGWGYTDQSFVDGSGLNSVVVPLPPAAMIGLAGLGGVALAGRIVRRRQAV